jgi:hypothetical protein
VTPVELLAMIKRETGILVMGSLVPREPGEIGREFITYLGDGVHPFRAVREATPDEIERQRLLIARIYGSPLRYPWPYSYVVEAD